ncbi:ferritin-like domain-containing protein [Hymenobacter tibetensis]|uniref:Ferritin-like domain-containing protein n=1 Tax=Hymenobacter tibetensis TaxID=497967 RepID=A0ABY4D3P2_9BACT|nr:ferritin-like domain-containing protein [Hymenobacter tibetensis]UOG75824.1 ferritin-like domain-containing protein [Hymenobacter tibetensis]
MDLFKLISEIEQVDPEIYGRIDTRRRVFKHFGLAGKAVTAAVLPGLVSGIFQRAYGQGTATALPTPVQDVLNLALSLEYLEYYFYDSGLKAAGLIPDADRPAFVTIRNDESGHIKVLRGVPGFTNIIPDPTRAAFDYSGGRGTGLGPFAPALVNDYALFLGSSQAFVDTGVRAYKGGAPVLKQNKDLLEAALNIHSVEARHSSHVRTVRRGLSAGQSGQAATTVAADLNNLSGKTGRPKSWISGNDGGGPSPTTNPSTAPVYAAGNPATGAATAIFYPAESNTTQAGVDITANTAGIGAASASEAFDEPLDPASVKSIARNFVAASTALFL